MSADTAESLPMEELPLHERIAQRVAKYHAIRYLHAHLTKGEIHALSDAQVRAVVGAASTTWGVEGVATGGLPWLERMASKGLRDGAYGVRRTPVPSRPVRRGSGSAIRPDEVAGGKAAGRAGGLVVDELERMMRNVGVTSPGASAMSVDTFESDARSESGNGAMH